MTMRKILGIALALGIAALAAQPATAGGALETADITSGAMTFPPFFDGKMIPIRWDDRCIPVSFTFRNTGAPAGALGALNSAFASWNAIPTSYIQMGIGTVDPVTPPSTTFTFDFVNEINFNVVAGFLAAAPSVSLITDTTLVAGMDIDGDGDSDVDASLTSCADADGDGDIEFAPGFYKAGTILENDVLFSSLFTWVTTPTASNDVDIEGVAVHEFGHSHGLSHTMMNQFQHQDCNAEGSGSVTTTDLPGTGVTMFPFIDIGDPAAEISQRSIEQDDVSWSSFTYPEGSTATGPGALQAGDVDFNDVFGVITGEVFSGAQGGVPLAGASVQVCDPKRGVVGEGFSGTTQVGVFPFFGLPSDVGSGFFLVGPQSFHILDGKYSIPVPKGQYRVFTEALDGRPAGAGNISITAILGSIFGQLNFDEEFWKSNFEAAVESEPGKGETVVVRAGKTVSGVDFTTNVTTKLSGGTALNFVGFTGSPGGRQYAVRYPGASVSALLGGGSLLTSGQYFTFVSDRSVVPALAEFKLAGGSVDGTTGNLVVQKMLRKEKSVVGQDFDSTPFFFENANGLSNVVASDLAKGKYADLVLIMELPPGPFPGVSAFPPLTGLDASVPTGTSFISDDGGVTFTPVTTFDFLFDLVFSP